MAHRANHVPASRPVETVLFDLADLAPVLVELDDEVAGYACGGVLRVLCGGDGLGTLPVDKVISSGGTAIAVAAEPTLGRASYWLMTVTALFATAGATNAGLYPAPGLSERLAETGQFPPLMTRKLGGRASAGLLIEAAVCLVLALGFKLDAIASIGSAVALVIFTLITAAHLRIRSETGASLPILVLAIVAAAAVFVTFVHHPHPRAGLDGDAARRPCGQHRTGPGLEALPRREGER